MLVGVRREIGRHKQDLQRQRDEDLKAADAWKGETIRDLYQTVADQFARGVLNPDGSQSQPRLSSVPPLPKAVPEETRGTSD
ncbi:hypothetical protein ABZX62_00095 [Streptomyces flavidovirens]|uniref:hypothetical protein n=1 Tax=Streptomyces flavidovirens TaxID=67298 RepID=UPI00339FCBE8